MELAEIILLMSSSIEEIRCFLLRAVQSRAVVGTAEFAVITVVALRALS